jgi:fumarate reductase subunit C
MLFICTYYRYMFRPLLPIFRLNIQLIFGNYCTYNGSVVLLALCTIKLQFITYLANPCVVSLNVRVGVVAVYRLLITWNQKSMINMNGEFAGR